MIIDPSYFTGKLNLPQRGNTEGLVYLQGFIDQYEPEFLQEALGYDLYKAFIDGLEQLVVEQRWIDLLNGVEYQFHGRTRKWIGFLPLSAGASMTIDGDNKRDLTAGGPGEFDPVPGSSSLTLPPSFVGVNFDVEIRGTGTLKPTEYTVVGDTLTLADGALFNDGTVIFLRKATALTIGSTTTLKVSPIANYVYYRIREDGASDTTLIGEVVSETDNNHTVNAMDKMIAAWNQMVNWLYDLLGWLTTNSSLYPEWKRVCSYSMLWRDWTRDWGYSKSEVYQIKNSFDL